MQLESWLAGVPEHWSGPTPPLQISVTLTLSRRVRSLARLQSESGASWCFGKVLPSVQSLSVPLRLPISLPLRLLLGLMQAAN